MSCTRLYVDPTETLTGKGMKMTLLRNGQSCQYRYPDLILLKITFSIANNTQCTD